MFTSFIKLQELSVLNKYHDFTELEKEGHQLIIATGADFMQIRACQLEKINKDVEKELPQNAGNFDKKMRLSLKKHA